MCPASCWSCCYICTQCCHTGSDALLEPGVYTLEDLRIFGRKQGWCPYFLARHMLAFANVVVYNYQYMLDPKVCDTRYLHATYPLCMHVLFVAEYVVLVLSLHASDKCLLLNVRISMSLRYSTCQLALLPSYPWLQCRGSFCWT